MNEPCSHRVSLESHKDNLVLCNLLCGAQVLVHVSTRGKNKSMTDIIMCQKIYGQRERRGEKNWRAHFLAPPPPLNYCL